MALDTVAGLFDRVQLNLGRGAHSTIVSMIPDWVNLTQRCLCLAEKWWWNFAEDTTGTLAAGGDTISLPSDFLDDEYLIIKTTSGDLYEIEDMEYLEYRRRYTDKTDLSERSRPKHYLLRTADILMRPIADTDYTTILGYWKQLADLVSGGATNNLLLEYPDVLEFGGTYRGFEYMQEYDDAAYWKGRYDEEIKRMHIANAERELPGEFVLSVRSGSVGTRLGTRVRRVGGTSFYPRGGY